MKLFYGAHNISQKDIDSVVEVLKSDYLTQGPKVSEFENKFSKFVGAKYAVAVSNGTVALDLCTKVLGLKKNQNVITTPITFVASANCIRYRDANVWFCDINPDTYNIDLKKLEVLIKTKPKGFFSGIIPVNFAGLPVNLEEVSRIAKKYNLWIIEDSCHSPGGYIINSTGKKIKCGSGTYSDLSIFSFHPVKHIAAGEGGMITTNNKILYDKLNILRTHGITKKKELLNNNDGGWYYEMIDLGYNCRLSDIQCALGISQLDRIGQNLKKRWKIAENYFNHFKNKNYIISQSSLTKGHAYHLYIIQVKNRKELYDFLASNNIYCQIHYIPIHKFPYYSKISNNNENLINSEEYYKKCLTLPIYPELSKNDQQFVINKIDEFFKC